ncbi:hypothetical protein ACETRX_36660 [Labrys portucalensis]|uniref:DUF899 domain-containing protein n=1 Tax=Labrys neptuniae TaxID=376174 RepID=A0ABV6ZSE7_9HYPH
MSEDKGRPNEWAARRAATDSIVQYEIEMEALARQQKTARLKALRQARDTLPTTVIPGGRKFVPEKRARRLGR